MADTSTNGEPCVLNHFIEDFIIQESSWPFTVSMKEFNSVFNFLFLFIRIFLIALQNLVNFQPKTAKIFFVYFCKINFYISHDLPYIRNLYLFYSFFNLWREALSDLVSELKCREAMIYRSIYSIIKHMSIFNEAELRITIFSIQAVSIQQI